jgi:nitrile hydratase subunit beta
LSLAPGTTVRVARRPHEGHHRTPGYLKGRQGRVERIHGRFRDPETRAYGRDGRPERELYLVSFDLPGGDRVLADVFEHWLEATE